MIIDLYERGVLVGLRVGTAKWSDAKKRWRIDVQKDNERKSFYSSIPGRRGQQEANKKADDWLDGGLINPSTRAQKLYEDWLAELKLTTGKGHWKNIESIWNNWAKNTIGRKRCSEITEQDIQNAVNRAFKQGRSKKTLQNILGVLSAFIKYGRKRKATLLIVENVSIPRQAKTTERKILQPSDLAKLFTCDMTIERGREVYEMYVNAWRFEVATGLRIGEFIGLKWSDIKGNKISLTGAINKYNEVTDGKTVNAARSFTLTPMAINVLKLQQAILKKYGINSEYIFPQKNGDHIKHRTNHRHWEKFCMHNDIEKVRPYDLRHTFVSIVKELPEGLIKPVVGHSVNMDTYGTYGHEVDGEADATAALIQQQFAKIMVSGSIE